MRIDLDINLLSIAFSKVNLSVAVLEIWVQLSNCYSLFSVRYWPGGNRQIILDFLFLFSLEYINKKIKFRVGQKWSMRG